MISSGSPRKETPQLNGPGTQGPTRKHMMWMCHGFLWPTGQSSPSVSPLPWDVRVPRILNLESRPILLQKTGEGVSQVGREGLGRTSPQSFVFHSCCGVALAGIWRICRGWRMESCPSHTQLSVRKSSHMYTCRVSSCLRPQRDWAELW